MSDGVVSVAEWNRRVRERDDCDVCGDGVPDADAEHRYAAAAGVLAGPFCSSDCYWQFFGEGGTDE